MSTIEIHSNVCALMAYSLLNNVVIVQVINVSNTAVGGDLDDVILYYANLGTLAVDINLYGKQR